jgi:hypothetical protein
MLLVGTPSHPKIIDPTKVEVVGSLENWTAVDHLSVQTGKLQTIVFDCKNAGPGMYKCMFMYMQVIWHQIHVLSLRLLLSLSMLVLVKEIQLNH